MPKRISFRKKDLDFALVSLGLKPFSKKIIETQRGSIVIAINKDKLFAVKISAKDILDTEKGIIPPRSEGMLNEIEIAKKLACVPFIIFDSQIVTDKIIATSFEFIKGVSGFNIPIEHRIRAVVDLFRAVEKLHFLGFVHGDIHPGNIIFRDIYCDSYSIVLIDFELSHSMNNTVCSYPGKVEYLSPESAVEVLKTDFVQQFVKQDIYALGITILSMLAGYEIMRFSADGLSRKQKFKHVANRQIMFDLSLVNELFLDLARNILEIINKPISQQPESPMEFANQIGLNINDI